MKKLLLLGAGVLLAFANIQKDSDLDGVPDYLDKCPNTPFLETVNKYGCSKEQLLMLKKNRIKFNINAGFEYDGYKDYKDSKQFFATLSAKKNNFKVSLYYSLLNNGYESGYKSNDLITSIYYYYNSFQNISLKFGLKLYLPTHFNDKTDYAFYIRGIYFFDKFDIGVSEKHKIYGESGTNAKDTITIFADFPYKQFIFSPYAYTENSAYNSSKWYKYAGMSVYYQFNENYGFMIDSYLDLEESENYTVDGSINYNF